MKSRKIIVGILLLIILAVFIIRLFSGEDDWICQNGEWVEHGKPSSAMPTTACK